MLWHASYVYGHWFNFICPTALHVWNQRKSPWVVSWLLSWRKKTFFHGVAKGNDVTSTFNFDSQWKHHFDLNYPSCFFSLLLLEGLRWLLIDFLLLPKSLYPVRQGHNAGFVPTVHCAFPFISLGGTRYQMLWKHESSEVPLTTNIGKPQTKMLPFMVRMDQSCIPSAFNGLLHSGSKCGMWFKNVNSIDLPMQMVVVISLVKTFMVEGLTYWWKLLELL